METILIDKRGVAKMLGFSKRTVDNLMGRGMPHLRFGERRVRFSPEAVLRWCEEKYGTRRIGPLDPARN